MSKYLLALPVALSVAAFASQVSARDGAGRDAAMRRCTGMAYVHYRDESEQLFRADVYKACMVAAGYKPCRLLSTMSRYDDLRRMREATACTHKSRLFGNRWLPRATSVEGLKVNDGLIDIDGGFKNCLDSFVADVSVCRRLNGFWARLPYHIRLQLRFSGDLPPPSPPAEKATACQDQTGKSAMGRGQQQQRL